MPSKKPVAKATKAPKAAGKPAPAPKPSAKPTKSRRKPSPQRENTAQMHLFEGPDLNPVLPRMIPIQIPEGVPITFGTPGAPSPTNTAYQEQNLVTAMRTILSLPRDQIRQVFEDAGATAAQVINLSTTAHGMLYRLAAIGGKVTQRGPRPPKGAQDTQE